MPSLRERIDLLEADLTAPESRISSYHDMPFAIFRYDPEEEFEARKELSNLITRLINKYGKEVVQISLAELMFIAIQESVGLEALFKAEEAHGLESTIDTLQRILTDIRPLHQMIAERLSAYDPKATISFITRAGVLFPAFRTSALLESMKGLVEVPTVLLYPGTLEGTVGLRFMGVCEANHNYRPKIY